MREYSEAFGGFDVSKTKHAVAIADGGRAGEVRFLGDIPNFAGGGGAAASAQGPAAMASCISATWRGRPGTGYIGRSRLSATPAW